MKINQNKKQKGYTLLEYCAGAAVVATILWTAMSALGGQMQTAFTNIGSWVIEKSNIEGNITTN